MTILPAAPPRFRRRRRVRKRTILLGIVAIVGVMIWNLSTSASRMVRAAKEEADRVDPGWTLRALEANRESIPDAENSGMQIGRVARLLQNRWPTVPRIASKTNPSRMEFDTDVTTRLGEVPPDVRPSFLLVVEARGDLAKLDDAVIEARKLADMPNGRFVIGHSQNPIMTLLPHLEHVRNVARLLQADAILRAEDGDLDGALESCRAILNAARALGEEPFAVSQLVRIALVDVATRTIELVLAQGEPSERALAKVQVLLLAEAKFSPVLASMRGERASVNDLMEKLTSGELDLGTLNGMIGTSLPARLPFTTAFYQYNHGLILANLNRAVELAKRPDPEHLAVWNAWEDSAKPPDQFFMKMLGSLNYMLLPAMRSIDDAHLKHRGRLASTLALVAAERHRIAHGAPPQSLEAIDPKLAEGLIGDPFVGGPVRFKPGPRATVLYTVGFDAKDDGGTFGKMIRSTKGIDLGVTWWQPRERRKPAKDELPKNVFQTPGRQAHDEADPIP